MGKNDLEFKVVGTNEQLADYLENLASGLRKSTLYIEQGSQAVTLTPSEELTMELSAKRKEEKQKLSLKLSWRTVPKVAQGDSALKISTNIPDPAPAEPAEDELPVSIEEDSKDDEKSGESKAAKASGGSARSSKKKSSK